MQTTIKEQIQSVKGARLLIEKLKDKLGSDAETELVLLALNDASATLVALRIAAELATRIRTVINPNDKDEILRIKIQKYDEMLSFFKQVKQI